MSPNEQQELKQVDITQLSEIELKALAFDQIALRDQAQANLNAILAEINKRNQPPVNIPEGRKAIN